MTLVCGSKCRRFHIDSEFHFARSDNVQRVDTFGSSQFNPVDRSAIEVVIANSRIDEKIMVVPGNL